MISKNLTNRMEKVKRSYKRYGFKACVWEIISSITPKFYKKSVHVIMEGDLTQGHEPPDPKIRLIKITKEHTKTMKLFTEQYEENPEMPIKVTRHYIRNNYNGYMAVIDDQIIGYTWWTNNKVKPELIIPELKRYGIKLKDNEVYYFDFFIAPPFRRGGAAFKVANAVIIKVGELGYKRGFATVSEAFRPARFVYKATGFKDISKVVLYKLLSSVLYMNNAIYLKTTRWHPHHPLDYQLLYDFENIKSSSK